MATFPKTEYALLAQIKDLPPGQDGAAWTRFWELYAPAMRTFAVYKGGESNADDIVMTVLGKLVDVLRSGQYTPEKGSFHSYLAVMIYNEVHMQHRKDAVRKSDAHVPIDDTMIDQLPAATPDVDDDWQRAIVAAAKEHVLTKTALSERDRAIYRFLVDEGHTPDEAAQHFKMVRNTINKIKSRIDQRIAAIGREMALAAERL